MPSSRSDCCADETSASAAAATSDDGERDGDGDSAAAARADGEEDESSSSSPVAPSMRIRIGAAAVVVSVAAFLTAVVVVATHLRGGGGIIDGIIISPSSPSFFSPFSPFSEEESSHVSVDGDSKEASSAAAPAASSHHHHGTTARRIERGRPISPLVTSRELYEAYRTIREEYDARAFDRSRLPDWKTIRSTSDGVEISLLRHPSDPACPYVRMTATVDATRREVWDFLALDNWERTMPHMDPFYEGLEMLGRYRYGVGAEERRRIDGAAEEEAKITAGGKKKTGRRGRRRKDRADGDNRGGGGGGGGGNGRNSNTVEMVLARKRTSRIVTFGRRDFTFVSVSDVPRPDGVWVSGTVSVVTDKFPRYDGYVRAFQDSIAFYEPLPPLPESGDNAGREERTRLTIVCRIDLNDSAEGGEGGVVPMWIYVKTIGLTGVSSLRSMRRRIEVDRRAAEGEKGAREDEEREAAARVKSDAGREETRGGADTSGDEQGEQRTPSRWCRVPAWMRLPSSTTNRSPPPPEEDDEADGVEETEKDEGGGGGPPRGAADDSDDEKGAPPPHEMLLGRIGTLLGMRESPTEA